MSSVPPSRPPQPTLVVSPWRARLTRSLLPPWLLRINRMMLIELREARPLPRAMPGVEIRWGTPEDEPLLQQVRPRSRSYLRHFEERCDCVIGLIDGKPASFSWLEPGPEHHSRANGYCVRFGSDARWAFGFEVQPAFRLSGIFHKHWIELLALARTRGVTRVLGSVQADNPHSVNSHRRLGFRVLGTLTVRRLLGLTWHRFDPEPGSSLPASRGFGIWVGNP